MTYSKDNTNNSAESSTSSENVYNGFMFLFRGRKDAWGSVEGKANKEAVTEEHYHRHLAGKVSLGVYPLLDNGTCHFAAIDLDDKNFDKAVRIRSRLKDLNVPSYIAQSRSKGYHIYVFAEDKFIAKDVRWLLHSVARQEGHGVEVFPKQDRLEMAEQGTRGWLQKKLLSTMIYKQKKAVPFLALSN